MVTCGGGAGGECGSRNALISSGVVKPAVDQLQENLVDDFLVGGKLRRNAHLLHQRIRNALPRFRPDLQEVFVALPLPRCPCL